MISRRRFMSGVPKVMAALAVTPAVIAETWEKSPVRADANFPGYDHFAGQLNTTFRVQVPGREPIELQLIKARLSPRSPIRPGRRAPGDAENEKFSVIFRGPGEKPLTAAIHTVEHERLGTLAIYFGEVGAPENDYRRYEAVFNCARASTGAPG